MNFSLLSLVSKLSLSISVTFAIGFLYSVIIVRYLGAELYGGYQYFIAITAFPAMFYSQFDSALNRFLPELNKQDKVGLLLAIVAYKYIILLTLILLFFILSIIFPKIIFWQNNYIVNDYQLKFVFNCMVALIPIELINSSLNTYASGLLKIITVQVIRVCSSIARLLVLLLVLWNSISIQKGIEIISISQVIIAGIVTLSWFILFTRWGDFWVNLYSISFYQYIHLIKYYSKTYVKRYIMPLQAGNVFAFVKEYLPLIIMGQQSFYTTIAYYEVIRKFFNLANKVIPLLFASLLPKIVNNARTNPNLFVRRFHCFSWFNVSFHLIIGLGLFLTHSIWLELYNFEVTHLMTVLILIFFVNLVVLGLSKTSTYIVLLSESTKPLFISSLVRSIVVTICIFILTPIYFAKGAALSLLIASLVNAFIINIYASKSRYYSWLNTILQILFSFVIMLFICNRMIA
jgi:O-antigen/teichoic acid export membrane protein